MSYEIPDPNALTIAKLKSILVQEGFGDQLPARAEKKDFYVDLYRKNIVPLLQARNAHSRTPGPRASLATTTLASAQDRTAQTDFVNRRKTIHTLAPDTAAAAEPTKTTKPSKPAQTGPSTPAPKSASSSTAPRRLTFSPEASVPVPTAADEPVDDDHTTPTVVAADGRTSAPSSSTSTTTSSSSSAILSPSARRVTLPPGAISYPKLSAPATPAPTSAAVGASDLSPDLRRIIAAQRAHKKAGRGGGGSSWLLISLMALVVALVAAAAGLALAHQQGHQLPAGLADLAALLPLPASSLLSSSQPYFCDTSVHPYPGRAGATAPPAGVTPSGGKCVDCPHYGVCKDGRLIKCMTGYVPSGGVRCVRDQDIARAIDLCREEAHHALAIRAGQVECGYDVAPLPMPELELKEILKQKTKEAGLFRPWDEAKFAEAFLELKRDLQRPPTSATPARISMQVVGSNYTFTTVDAQLPWTCVARRAAWAHVHYIAGAVVVLLGALLLAVQQRRRAEREADIVSLVQRTKELLKQTKRRASSGGAHAWVPVIEIRDLLFHEDPDFAGRYGTIAEKLAVWAVAERRLRADTRIREYAQMVEQQQQLVWEYIGTVEEELAQNVLLSPRGSSAARKSMP